MKASGADDNLADVQDYAQAVIQSALEHGVTKILCDERDLEYRLSTLDTYQLAQSISSYAPRIGTVAIVCKQQNLKVGGFYETAMVNRGVYLKVTADYQEALDWVS